ncbi:disease resistance protein [Salix suchowensis]|nr:disease resistance protein [Salix suchowensis]
MSTRSHPQQTQPMGNLPKAATNQGDSRKGPSSWADKVKVTNANTRYSLDPMPRLPMGQQLIIPEDVMEGVDQWMRCLVGFFPRSKMPYHAINNMAMRVWRTKGLESVTTTANGFILFRFKSQENLQEDDDLLEEAWTLFMEKLGHDIELSREVERIARDIARECTGLPLGVITMAGSLRGLHDLAQQQCLLYCALFPEDHCIERKRLIGYLIDEGIIKRMGSRQVAFDVTTTANGFILKILWKMKRTSPYGNTARQDLSP